MANPIPRIRLFAQETVGELKKTVWPTKVELRDSTVVVLVAIALLGLCTALFDFSIYSWVNYLTRLVRGA